MMYVDPLFRELRLFRTPETLLISDVRRTSPHKESVVAGEELKWLKVQGDLMQKVNGMCASRV